MFYSRVNSATVSHSKNVWVETTQIFRLKYLQLRQPTFWVITTIKMVDNIKPG